MKPNCKLSRGSILLLVTLALIPMFAVLGLAVDLGWAFYVKREAQAAADTAALAAAKAAMDTFNAGGATLTCGSLGCTPAPNPCPAAGGISPVLNAACLYAERNFPLNARRSVTVQASDSATAPTVQGTCGGSVTLHSPPTAPCVNTYYWITVRVNEQVPQLFSRVFGGQNVVVSARATAAVAETEIPGSLFLLNRQNDSSA